MWNQWATRWVPGFDFHRDIRHGLRLREVVADLVSAEHVAAATENLIDMELTLATDVPPIPGAPELIADCPARLMGVGDLGPPLRGTRPLNLGGDRPPCHRCVRRRRRIGASPPQTPTLPAQRRSASARTSASFSKTLRAGILSARAAGIAHVIGVGEATVGEDVDAAVSSLSGITFDGTHVSIPPELIIEPH